MILDTPEFNENLIRREQGLRPTDHVSGTEPRVEYHDLTVNLPDNYGATGHAYGTPAEFIAYIRHVNRIPEAAATTIESEEDRGIITRWRVRFEWWTIHTWEMP